MGLRLCRPSRDGSRRDLAAVAYAGARSSVDQDVGAGEVAGGLACTEGEDCSDLLRFAEAFQGGDFEEVCGAVIGFEAARS